MTEQDTTTATTLKTARSDATLTRLGAAASEASHWLAGSGPGEESRVARLARQEARLAARLASAAQLPPAVAVYGASQAGKSYLVSSLTSPEDGPLVVRYGQDRLDFLKDMNPDGGGESSGLVTRFTTVLSTAASGIPPNAPVPIRLLSALDVLKIAGNSFFADFKLTTPPPAEESALSVLEKIAPTSEDRSSPQPNQDRVRQAVLSRGDIEELERYFTARFAANPWFRTLGTVYWARLAESAESLSADEFLRALAPLWGNIEEIGAFAGEVFRARLKLGPGEIAFCTTEALLPREKSILNVQTLTGKTRAGDETLGLTAPDRRETTITRRMASALAAELIAPLAHERWSFQKGADILDFPGARSRLLIRAPEDAHGKGAELFLRGKVDHLFQRYQEDFDITAMLLCIGDSAQEVRELPRLVTSWVEQTLGATPRARAEQEDALFLVLTKFDTALVAKEGSEDSQPGRWNERLGASIVNYFDAPTERAWLDEWKPGQPFDNTQWLRNASYGDTYERAPDGRETTLKPSLAARLPALKEGYERSDRVQRYIHAPMTAFDEAMRPNDGGVSYMAGRLAPVTATNPKTRQLRARALDCARALTKSLTPYYHDETARDPAAEAATLLKAVGPQLLALAKDRQVFGAFLRRLSPERTDMIAAWKAFSRESTPTHEISSDALLKGLLGGHEDGLSTENETGRKKFDDFAERAIETWKEKTLFSLRDDPRERAYFGLDRESYDRLVAQLLALAESTNANGQSLAALLSARLRESCDYDSPLIQSGEKQGVICAQTIGDFVAYLGYAPLHESEARAVSDNPRDNSDDNSGSENPISSARQPRNNTTGKPIFMLPDDPMGFLTRTREAEDVALSPELIYCLDWLAALLARAQAAGPQYDREANARLGRLLETLKTLENDWTRPTAVPSPQDQTKKETNR